MEIQTGSGLIALVDDDIFAEINKYKWHVSTTTGYVLRWKSRKDTSDLPRGISMHRHIMGNPKGLIDHINGNRLDNRRINLRVCDDKGNGRNVAMHKDNKSGYKGVTWAKQRRKWVATICYDYKSYNLGGYEDIKEAALAYNSAAVRFHGEFARLNVIE